MSTVQGSGLVGVHCIYVRMHIYATWLLCTVCTNLSIYLQTYNKCVHTYVLYMYVYVCMYVYMYAHVCTYVRIYMHIYIISTYCMYVCIRTYVQTFMYVCTRTYV